MLNQYLQKINLNWKSGLTVALVSIPLSISLAVASQTTPQAGIITAIWAGLIASIFGGSNFNIIGPTGALSGFLAGYAIIHGIAVLPTLAIISGLFILVAYFLRLEKYLIFVPGSTIHGFTLGIAIIIILNQLNFIFGLSNLKLHKSLIGNVTETFLNISNFSSISFIVFCFFLISIMILSKFIPKIPAIILICPFGILLGYISKIYSFDLQTLGTKFGQVTGNLFNFTILQFDQSLILGGLTIAFISILETLISAKIADTITKTKYNQRKEILGLSLANIISGLLGGIPATAALARTTLNIRSGATDKISQGISSIFIAILALIFLGYFSYMPLAAIAAILVFVAIRMIEAEHFLRLFSYDKTNFYLSIFVALVTVLEDPIIGVILGSVISLLIFMKKISHGYFEYSEIKKKKQKSKLLKSNTVIYYLSGPLGYINAQSHLAHFENNLESYKNKTIVLNLKGLYFTDLDGIDTLNEIIDLLKSKNIKVKLVGINFQILEILKNQSKHY